MTLPLGFKLSVASVEDMPEVFRVLTTAFADDEVWKHIMNDCAQADVLPWVIRELCPRWVMPDIETYKIVEEASGYHLLSFHWNAFFFITNFRPAKS